MSFESLNPRESSGRVEEGWTYLDVRTVAEFEQGHAAGAFTGGFKNLVSIDGGFSGRSDRTTLAISSSNGLLGDCK